MAALVLLLSVMAGPAYRYGLAGVTELQAGVAVTAIEPRGNLR